MFQTACLNILFQLLLPNPEDTVEWFDCKVPQIAWARQTWAMQRWLECMVWRHKPCTHWQAMSRTSHVSMPHFPWVSPPRRSTHCVPAESFRPGSWGKAALALSASMDWSQNKLPCEPQPTGKTDDGFCTLQTVLNKNYFSHPMKLEFIK